MKWLARLPEMATLHVEEGFEWEFAAPAKLPRPLLTLEHIAAGYGDRRVLSEVALSVSPGDRLGILGRNGPGPGARRSGDTLSVPAGRPRLAREQRRLEAEARNRLEGQSHAP